MNRSTGGSSVGAGAGRARRELVPSVAFVLFFVTYFVYLFISAGRSGEYSLSGFCLALPWLLVGLILEGTAANGTLRMMALAEAEGKAERRQRIYDTGVLFQVSAGVLLTLAVLGLFELAGIVPPGAAAAAEEFRAWIRGFAAVILPGSLFYYYALLLFSEGREKSACAIQGGILVLLLLLRPSAIIRGSVLTGTGFLCGGVCLLGALACRICLGRRLVRSHRIALEPSLVLNFFREGAAECVAAVCFALLFILLDLLLPLIWGIRVLPVPAAVSVLAGVSAFAGEGLALAMAPMQRIYFDEHNARGMYRLVSELLPRVLIVSSALMLLTFAAAPFLAAACSGSNRTLYGEMTLAVRMFSPFSMVCCLNSCYAAYFRRTGERELALRMMELALLLPYAGVVLALIFGGPAWTGFGAGAGIMAGFQANVLTVLLRGKQGQESREGWLLLDQELLEGQYFESVPATRDGVKELLGGMNAFLGRKQLPEYTRIRLAQRAGEMEAAVLTNSGNSGQYSLDCTLTVGRTLHLILRDDAPVREQADPRQMIRSFRMYALSREMQVGADGTLSPALAENRTVFRL